MIRSHSAFRRQTGATLLVGLIMLILMSLLAVSAMRLSNTNIKVVANEQFRNEARAAAEFALDKVANDPDFVTNYALSSTSVNVNTGMAPYSVTVTKPTCKRYRVVPKSSFLVPSGVSGVYTVSATDSACITGVSGSPLTIVDLSGTATGDSFCANTLWEVEATVSDPATGASAKVTDGIELRMTIPEAQTGCK